MGLVFHVQIVRGTQASNTSSTPPPYLVHWAPCTSGWNWKALGSHGAHFSCTLCFQHMTDFPLLGLGHTPFIFRVSSFLQNAFQDIPTTTNSQDSHSWRSFFPVPFFALDFLFPWCLWKAFLSAMKEKGLGKTPFSVAIAMGETFSKIHRGALFTHSREVEMHLVQMRPRPYFYYILILLAPRKLLHYIENLLQLTSVLVSLLLHI